MLSNKFLMMSIALFAIVLAVSAQESEDIISDRRFRWEGSNELELEDDEESGDDTDVEESNDESDSADDSVSSGAEVVLPVDVYDDNADSEDDDA